MKWFRANIRHGSKLALLALAIQFALSFGHFHASAALAAPSIQSAVQHIDGPSDATRANIIATRDLAGQSLERKNEGLKPASDPDSDKQSNDTCAICAVIAMANAVLSATPPLLPLPQAVEFRPPTTDAKFIDLNSVRVAFQPRGPPIS